MEDEQPRSHLRYRALIGGLVLLIIIVLRRAMLTFNVRLIETRNAFWPIMRSIVWIIFVGIILLAIILFGINFFAKRDEKRKPSPPQEDTF